MAKSPVIVIQRELLKSKAWLKLTGTSTQVYMLFLCKRKFSRVPRKKKKTYVCTNDKGLEFTYKEASKAYRITKRQFTKSVDQLVMFGFISVIYTGGGHQRDKSIYGLIENWQNFGQSNFKTGKSREIDPVQRGYRRSKVLRYHRLRVAN